MHGDQRAFELLFGRYYPELVRYVRRLIGNLHLAEDLAQEVFVRFLRQRSYRPDRRFRPWLFAVTTNAVRDHLRASRRQLPAAPIDLDEPSPAPQPFDVVAGRMAAMEVSTLLLRLPLEYRETIALRIGSDMALADIAETLAIPVGTVKSRLSLGLRQLRELLSQIQLEDRR